MSSSSLLPFDARARASRTMIVLMLGVVGFITSSSSSYSEAFIITSSTHNFHLSSSVKSTRTRHGHQQQQQQQVGSGMVSPSFSSALLFSASSSSNNNNNNDDDDDGNTATAPPPVAVTGKIWSPTLRKIMGAIASLGMIETGYLTMVKITNNNNNLLLCGGGGGGGGSGNTAGLSSCDQVLNGPYSTIPYLQLFHQTIPLAAGGLLAYLSVVVLAVQPIIRMNTSSGDDGNTNTSTSANTNADDDTINRIVLTVVTTMMGTFSIFLMTLLFGVIEPTLIGGGGGSSSSSLVCPYCIFSATCSILLANIALFGDCLPSSSSSTAASSSKSLVKTGANAVATGFVTAIVGAVVLFSTGSLENNTNNNNNSGIPSTTSSLLASISGGVVSNKSTNTNNKDAQSIMKIYSPPAITTDSSKRAIQIATKLKALDARMYGAYWCSHCYDQKEAFGKQVFSSSSSSSSSSDAPATEAAYTLEYIECSKDGANAQAKLCKEKEIPGFPTWEIRGKLYPGEQELDELETLIQDIENPPSTSTSTSTLTTDQK